jgi:hypothetical protein
MKTYITIIFSVLLNLLVYGQTNIKNYLDFFGNKYQLNNDTSLTNYLNDHLNTPEKSIHYKFYGKQFLQKDCSTINDPNDPYKIVTTTSYKITKELDVFNLIDSIDISTLSRENVFEIYENKTKFMITNFTIIGDSSDKEISWTNMDFEYNKYNQHIVPIYLIVLIKEYKESSKYLLTDIWYYDTIRKTKCILDCSILLK